MRNVFAVRAGDEIRIGAYGVATIDRPAVVPASVVAELAGRADLRVEDLGPEPVAAPEVQAAPVVAAPKKGRG